MMTTHSRQLLRSLLSLILAASVYGCVNTPYDEQVYPSKSSLIPFSGATPITYNPTSETNKVQVWTWNYRWSRWGVHNYDEPPQPKLKIDPGTGVLGYTYPPPFDAWHPYLKQAVLDENVWTFEGDLPIEWLPQARLDGTAHPTAAVARIRVVDPVTEQANGSYNVMPQGYSLCVQGYSTFEEATQPENCGPYGDQKFARIYTGGYTEQNYVIRDVVVAALSYLEDSSGAPVEVDNEYADDALYAASSVIQAVDGPPGTTADRACAAAWKRKGHIRLIGSNSTTADGQVNPDTDGVINATEFDWLVKKGKELKAPDERVVIVVNQIEGGAGRASSTENVAVVAIRRSNTSLAVQDITPEEQGPLWAHELLHTHMTAFPHSVLGHSLLTDYTRGGDQLISIRSARQLLNDDVWREPDGNLRPIFNPAGPFACDYIRDSN